MSSETLNLRRILEDDPWQGLLIELGRSMAVTTSTGQLQAAWAAKVFRNRLTNHGRRGKPEYLIGILGNEGERPGALLRTLADALDQGDVPVER